MSQRACTQCARDLEDCSCTSCLCAPCVSGSCPCLQQVDPLDELISKASALDLGALYRAAQKTGLIKPVAAYSNSA